MKDLPRRGQRVILAVRPLDWYAGSVGVGAVVEEVSDSAIYVLFDGGLRESFPPSRFVEYFKSESTPVPKGTAASAGERRARSSIIHR